MNNYNLKIENLPSLEPLNFIKSRNNSNDPDS